MVHATRGISAAVRHPVEFSWTVGAAVTAAVYILSWPPQVAAGGHRKCSTELPRSGMRRSDSASTNSAVDQLRPIQ